MYSAFDHWAYWSHMLTVISMFSPCTQWVFGPLSPVNVANAETTVRDVSNTQPIVSDIHCTKLKSREGTNHHPGGKYHPHFVTE